MQEKVMEVVAYVLSTKLWTGRNPSFATCFGLQMQTLSGHQIKWVEADRILQLAAESSDGRWHLPALNSAKLLNVSGELGAKR